MLSSNDLLWVTHIHSLWICFWGIPTWMRCTVRCDATHTMTYQIVPMILRPVGLPPTFSGRSGWLTRIPIYLHVSVSSFHFVFYLYGRLSFSIYMFFQSWISYTRKTHNYASSSIIVDTNPGMVERRHPDYCMTNIVWDSQTFFRKTICHIFHGAFLGKTVVGISWWCKWHFHRMKSRFS